MANSLMRLALQRVSTLGPRTFSTSSAAHQIQDVQLSQEQKDKFYPKIGNRDIVGYGFNGFPNYIDWETHPCPAIRFKENTPDVVSLREKEKGDWKKLTMDEKKALYRASFCQTFAEMNAPTGEWKRILAGLFLGLTATGWIMIFIKKQVYPPVPHTITKKWQEEQVKQMVLQGQGHISGLASKYDYEKKQWK